MEKVQFHQHVMSVQDLINRYKNKELGLEPGFQRSSVWGGRDRERLIDSILHNYPLPSIFLYRREEEGKICYDVIDGKQRIESILMFVGEKRGNRFETKTCLPDQEEERRVDWATLKNEQKQHLITGYQLHIIEVAGELSDIIDLFVRINSTGKALTRAEKDHAKYYNSPFLKEASSLAKRWEPYLLHEKILSPRQISRMKHVELVCELIVSVEQRDVIDKKRAVDTAMVQNSIKGRNLNKSVSDARRSLQAVKRIFPNLRKTRLRKISDFYSLVILVRKFDGEGFILTDKHQNHLADNLLAAFSTCVDKVSNHYNRLEEISSEEELYRSYLATVQANSDGLRNRRGREKILRGILESLFQKKDSDRHFSPEQRRILWNSTDERKCSECSIELRWEYLTIDHINPHAKGGRTALDNAALMCRSCNSRKGSR